MSKTTDKKPAHDDGKPGKDGAPSTPSKPDERRSDNSRDAIGKRLDEGLEETFPSSDPVSVKITK